MSIAEPNVGTTVAIIPFIGTLSRVFTGESKCNADCLQRLILAPLSIMQIEYRLWPSGVQKQIVVGIFAASFSTDPELLRASL